MYSFLRFVLFPEQQQQEQQKQTDNEFQNETSHVVQACHDTLPRHIRTALVGVQFLGQLRFHSAPQVETRPAHRQPA